MILLAQIVTGYFLQILNFNFARPDKNAYL